MPIADRFDFLDLVFFLKIVKELVPVSLGLPAYIIPYQGHPRLRSSHLDSLSFVSTIIPHATTNAFAKDFFFRAHTKWNHVPSEVRDINSVTDHSNANSRLICWKKSSLGQ
jgi:hypothetical protein